MFTQRLKGRAQTNHGLPGALQAADIPAVQPETSTSSTITATTGRTSFQDILTNVRFTLNILWQRTDSTAGLQRVDDDFL